MIAVLQLRWGSAQSIEKSGQEFEICMLNDRRRLGHYGLELLHVALLAGPSRVGYAGADIASAEMPLEAAGGWADPFRGGMRGELLDALLDPSNAALEEA